MEILRSFVLGLVDAVAPPLCVLCGGLPDAFPWLCESCARDLRLYTGGVCLRCGAPRAIDAPLCGGCPDWPKRLSAARSAGVHAGTLRHLTHALKYGRQLAVAQPLGHVVAASARQMPIAAGTVVVPVPLHRSRRRQRGFNQATEIARVAARALGLPMRPRWLRRVRDEMPSVIRSAAGRQRAVRGAFRAHEAVRGRPILLVDDVLTTGATLGACARALGRRGAGEIRAVTASRA